MYLPNKILISIIISTTVFIILVGSMNFRQNLPGGDITAPIQGAKAIIEGKDPYETTRYIDKGKPMAMYPLITYLIMIPFVPFGSTYGAYLFFALSTGLLVYAVLDKSPRWMLLVLLTGSFLDAFWVIQFSPLIAALYWLPKISILAIIKPQIGFPVLLKHIQFRQIVLIITIVALSFLFMPGWLSNWWHSARNYDGFIPLLTLPFGPLLMLLLFRWKNKDSRFLLVYSLVPQRGLYDSLPLLLLTRSKQEMLILWFFSLIAFFLQSKLYFTPYSYWSAFLVYLPLLFFAVKRDLTSKHTQDQKMLIPNDL